jgi:hypothetical protein
MFSKLELSPAAAGPATIAGRNFARVGGGSGLQPPSPEPADADAPPASDNDDWTPREPVAPPSDIAAAVIALIPIWAGIAWTIYTLLR